ncbi:TRAP-type C4-dicarboxylate transport system permease small subunit [Stella humosa]|uniref:TRAP transporter small permease protein n=2 Tax=Stella humosa TaxID=94 RepID=A0A3N1MCR9_9PROT|nr:TRAP-type C4-dicarboxylate transport system permease small subunit [Stella humosa]BBK31774.1 C4-dicarboxylate ABC transporter [Stella humosa]
MQDAYRRAMDALYLACIGLAGASVVVITLVVPWGVFTRYVLNRGSAWPEPMAILLMVLFTFLGAAACYRANSHIAVDMIAGAMPPPIRRMLAILVDLLLAALSLFMVVYGLELCVTTWHQVIAEFPFLSTGITYLPLPLGSALTLLFIIERMWIGPPPHGSIVYNDSAIEKD